MILSKTTLSITTLNIMTLSIMILNITTFNIMTLSIKGLYVTLGISDTVHNNDVPLACVSMLTVGFYSLLCCMSLYRMSLC